MKTQNTPSLPSPILSYGLVFLQFFCIGFLTFQLDWLAVIQASPWPLLIMGLALFIGLWALWHLKPLGFNIIPDPHESCQLCQQGPYRWIRHPMYAAILLFFWSAVLTQPSTPLIWGLIILLTIVLLIKLHYEEKRLLQKLPHYAHYQQHSHKLIPFIF